LVAQVGKLSGSIKQLSCHRLGGTVLTAQARQRCRSARGASDGSFDDLSGAGEDRWRHSEPKRLSGIEIDDQLECGRLLHRQISRLGARKYLADQGRGLAIDTGKAGPIAEQSAGHDLLAQHMDRRQRIARRQCRELMALIGWVGSQRYRLGCRHAPLCYRRHRFPAEIIQNAIWLYVRFTLS